MTAFYNEIDPYAAQWLRNLIAAGHIAPGVVDERSIEDIHPHELTQYTQCHFFAGVGVWSYALRLAGWPDDKPVWTGSCPCQPFSTAGEGRGMDDERHLWPTFQYLIQRQSPAIVFGEQVASKDAEPWLDLVQSDLEAMGYAFGCIPFPSAGVGAPHIRDRNFWVGHAGGAGLQGFSGASTERGQSGRLTAQPTGHFAPSGAAYGLADSDDNRHDAQSGRGRKAEGGEAENGSNVGIPREFIGTSSSVLIGLAHADSGGREEVRNSFTETGGDGPVRNDEPTAGQSPSRETNGFWANADWLFCRDGKWRPVEPGTCPLVNGPAGRLGHLQPGYGRFYRRNRTGRLKGYGNAINAQAAKIFIECVMESI